MQPLRDEHRELLPHIEHLKRAGDLVGASADSVRKAVDEVHAFLIHHLIPHAQAEDGALYPAVAKVLGAASATATMSRDHVAVGQLTEELRELRRQIAQGAISDERARDLRRVLYGLYTLVKVHFAKEEEIYLPLLDSNLSASEARDMFEAMEAIAERARAAAEG